VLVKGTDVNVEESDDNDAVSDAEPDFAEPVDDGVPSPTAGPARDTLGRMFPRPETASVTPAAVRLGDCVTESEWMVETPIGAPVSSIT
jgi:hypothetical protein